MIIFGAILLVILAIVYGLYVSLIKKRNRALEALSGIDVQLKKRHDLLPNILTIAKKFMEHEKELFSKVTEMRSLAGKSYNPGNPEEVGKHLEAEKGFQSAMMQLFAVAENYPDLKSQHNMIEAQQAYEEVEGHISAARRFYNSSVTDLNDAVQIFPSSTIAAMISIRAMPYFEMDEAEKQPVNAGDFL
ncbi:LemA family protein [Emcibacter sp.]|uniref:LemA family protein n=1 Tax=Emcibacter sp. TaxID=1979954 RepID=UPI002AA77E99|nr:LemA family protein [Emcibacter sp.]